MLAIVSSHTHLVDSYAPLQPMVITEDDGLQHKMSLENFAKAMRAFLQWGEGKSTGPNSILSP
jgi:hypothetical protein